MRISVRIRPVGDCYVAEAVGLRVVRGSPLAAWTELLTRIRDVYSDCSVRVEAPGFVTIGFTGR